MTDVEPKEEPAGNLKGKFAGLLALVGSLVPSDLFAPFALPCLERGHRRFSRTVSTLRHLAIQIII
jgi:hypothetical protein